MREGKQPNLATPARGLEPLASLLSGQRFPYFAARAGAWLGRRRPRPVKVGRTVVALTHSDVCEMLARDLDFVIEPVNRDKIAEVNGGDFILGLDRGEKLVAERQALYSALAELNLAPLEQRLRLRATERGSRLPQRFDAIADFARPVATETAIDLFGIGCDDPDLLADVARAIFAHTFLNLGNDSKIKARAVAAAPLLRQLLEAEIRKRRDDQEEGIDLMGQLLRQGKLDDDGVRRTLGGMLVGSIDTTVTCVAKIVCVALQRPALETAIREAFAAGGDIYGWCQEALRAWPHNPIVLRQAAADTSLSGTSIRKGDRVIAWTHAAMLDRSAFPDPHQLDGSRTRGGYLHLGWGLHPCAGRIINSVQIPMLVGQLLQRGIRRAGRLGWAGPFPDRLPVRTA